MIVLMTLPTTIQGFADTIIDVFVNVDSFRSYEGVRILVKDQHIDRRAYGVTTLQKEVFIPVEARVELFDDALAQEVVDRVGTICERRRRVIGSLLLGFGESAMWPEARP